MKRRHLGKLCETLTPPICGNLGVFLCNVLCQLEHHTKNVRMKRGDTRGAVIIVSSE